MLVALHHVFDCEHLPTGGRTIAAVLGTTIKALHGVVDYQPEKACQGRGASFDLPQPGALICERESDELVTGLLQASGSK